MIDLAHNEAGVEALLEVLARAARARRRRTAGAGRRRRPDRRGAARHRGAGGARRRPRRRSPTRSATCAAGRPTSCEALLREGAAAVGVHDVPALPDGARRAAGAGRRGRRPATSSASCATRERGEVDAWLRAARRDGRRPGRAPAQGPRGGAMTHRYWPLFDLRLRTGRPRAATDDGGGPGTAGRRAARRPRAGPGGDHGTTSSDAPCAVASSCTRAIGSTTGRGRPEAWRLELRRAPRWAADRGPGARGQRLSRVADRGHVVPPRCRGPRPRSRQGDACGRRSLSRSARSRRRWRSPRPGTTTTPPSGSSRSLGYQPNGESRMERRGRPRRGCPPTT